MRLTLECEQEQDGRWLAEVPQLPGVIAYGTSATSAMANAQALAFRTIADRLEHGSEPLSVNMFMPAKFAVKHDAGLLDQAKELLEQVADEELLRAALTALVERESSRALAELGGTEPNLGPVERRRPDPA
jgi:predicted RNase H-like HicB family nuclease